MSLIVLIVLLFFVCVECIGIKKSIIDIKNCKHVIKSYEYQIANSNDVFDLVINKFLYKDILIEFTFALITQIIVLFITLSAITYISYILNNF